MESSKYLSVTQVFGLRPWAVLLYALVGVFLSQNTGPLQAAEAAPAANAPSANDAAQIRAQFDKEREIIAKWVEINRIISAERQDWQTGKEILNERTALLERQIADLEKQVKETEDNLAKIQTEISNLNEQRKSEEAATAALRDNVLKFEDNVRVLFNRLPSPLQTKITPLFQRMPTDAKTTKITLAERFQNVIGILNEVSKLQNESSVVNEVRKVDGGKEVEVQTLYLGLTHGYYTSPTGEYVGYGHLTDTGWQWTSKPELAFELREIQAILTNKMKAKFVALPAVIQ
ncbi:MAG: DUF3450 family protein [Candidatus Methylacidiphilales bacterium]|nr:DUF3450 family protein [Candidatus Methylacidiphilales bacterium]